MANSKCRLIIKATTWKRDSYGLFDYETSENLERSEFSLDRECNIYREMGKVVFSDEEREELLCKVEKDQGAYQIAPGSSEEQIWGIVRYSSGSESKSGHKLSEKDSFRLGRVNLKVIEIKGFAQESRRSRIKETPLEIKPDIIAEEGCRVCLSSEQMSEDDPLITPCKCSGTMGVIHLNCLKQWLSSKVTVREAASSKAYAWKNLECELCKFKYPEQISYKDNTYDLLDIQKPEGNYVILETFPTTNKVMYVVSLQNKKNIRIGRGHDADVRITDISVSRSHATIRATRTGLFLEDNESKFGTLVKVKNPLILSNATPVWIQCGRSILNVCLKKQWTWASCLPICRSKKQDLDKSSEDCQVNENNSSQCMF